MGGVLAGLLVKTGMTAADIENEKDAMLRVARAADEVWEEVQRHDNDKDGFIDADEFIGVCRDQDIATRLIQVGVDLEGLGGVASFIMSQHNNRLDKKHFTGVLMDHRGSLVAKVKDHVQTRKFVDECINLAMKKAEAPTELN